MKGEKEGKHMKITIKCSAKELKGFINKKEPCCNKALNETKKEELNKTNLSIVNNGTIEKFEIDGFIDGLVYDTTNYQGTITNGATVKDTL